MLARFFCVLPLLLVPDHADGRHAAAAGRSTSSTTRSRGEASAKVGVLYAVNTFGAVAGSLLGSFVLMPAIGVHATNLVAVGHQRGRSACSSWRSREAARRVCRWPTRQHERAARVVHMARGYAWPPSPSAARAPARWPTKWSGRARLSMAIGSSLQAFALILVTFLVGIAAGSALLARLMRERAAHRQPAAAARGLCLAAVAARPDAGHRALERRPGLVRVAGADRGRFLVVTRALRGAAHRMRCSIPSSQAQAEHGLRRLATCGCCWSRSRLAPVRDACASACKRARVQGVVAARLPALRHRGGGAEPVRVPVADQRAARVALVSGQAPCSCSWPAPRCVSCVFQDEIPYTFARLVSSVRRPAQPRGHGALLHVLRGQPVHAAGHAGHGCDVPHHARAVVERSRHCREPRAARAPEGALDVGADVGESTPPTRSARSWAPGCRASCCCRCSGCSARSTSA